MILEYVLLIFVGLILFTTGYYNCTWHLFKIRNKFNNMPKDIEVINLGSTYANYAFKYPDTCRGFNAALVPQYLYYDNIILKKYSKNIKKNATVLLVLPDFVFAANGKKYVHDTYYEFLSKKEILNWNDKQYIQRRICVAKEPFTHTMRSQSKKWEGYVASEEEKKAHAKKRILDWENNILHGKMEEIEISEEVKGNIEENIQIVINIIEFCEENTWKVFLIIPPVSLEMKKQIPKDIINECLYRPIDEVIKKCENPPVLLDYSLDEDFQDLSLYFNSDCLNKTGSEIFTNKVLKDIDCF